MVAAVGKVEATVTKTAIRENVLVISFFFFFCSGCRKSAVFCFQVNHYYQCISRRTIAMVVAAIQRLQYCDTEMKWNLYVSESSATTWKDMKYICFPQTR